MTENSKMTESAVDDNNRTPIPTIDLTMSQQQSEEENQKINNTNNDNHESQHGHVMQIDENHHDHHGHHHKPKIWLMLEENWAVVSQPLAVLLISLLCWGLLFAILPKQALPNTTIMRMMFLFVGAQVWGIIISFIGLPDMLGMIFWGVFYTNVGWGNFDELNRLEIALREMALINIMLLAGLGLDLEALKKLSGIITKITVIPTIAETVVVAIVARYLLDMPWLWGFLLGLVVTAISPNVVVTILLKLKEERLGNKNIHTVIIAMCSCNDVIAIFCFGVLLGIIFSTGNLTHQLLQGPVGIVMGIVFGCVAGVILLKLPSNKSKYVNGLRFTIITLAGTIAVMGSKAIDYPSAGALGCVTVAFVAGTGWKTIKARDPTFHNEVPMYLDLLWKFLKPVSFSLIGKEVHFAVLDGNVVLYGCIALFLGVVVRLITAYLSALGADMTWKEKMYIAISSVPKATVQAALGPVALDLAKQLKSTEENFSLARDVLIISVLAIVLTAPLGAVVMTKLAPKWLKRDCDCDIARDS